MYRILGMFLCCVVSISAQANEVWRSKDEHGNWRFSDRPLPESTTFDLKPIKTVKWRKTKPVRLATTKSRAAPQPEPTSCERLRARISELERQLRRKQKPQKFEQLKWQLRKTRWEKMQKC